METLVIFYESLFAFLPITVNKINSFSTVLKIKMMWLNVNKIKLKKNHF